MARSPTIPETRMPRRTMWLLGAPSRFGTLCRAAPSVIGVARRKLNRAASSRR